MFVKCVVLVRTIAWGGVNYSAVGPEMGGTGIFVRWWVWKLVSKV